MSELLKSIDDRTQLAGTNRLEVLLFSLGKDRKSGREEAYGINVFKVREVMHVPEITRAPDMPEAVEGMVTLRGSTLPVINLPRYCGMAMDEEPDKMIITEYNSNVQGFLVHSVDNIERLAWDNIKTPPAIMDNQHGGLVTAVSEVDGKGLVMIIDVEKILADAANMYDDARTFQNIPKMDKSGMTVLFADDSNVARSQVHRALEEMGINYISCVNGQEAWDKLLKIQGEVMQSNQPITDRVNLVLTDVEMPEMDGYVLTRKIKNDERFSQLPVVMHSSLSAEANKLLGESVGADAYVSKFQPRELAETMITMLDHG